MSDQNQGAPFTFYYDPPYESPVHDEVAWHLTKYLGEVTDYAYQRKVTVRGHTQWLDFSFTAGGTRVVLEVEGYDRTDDTAALHHDARTMVGCEPDVLLACTYEVATYRIHDLFVVLHAWAPTLFRPPSPTVIGWLCSTGLWDEAHEEQVDTLVRDGVQQLRLWHRDDPRHQDVFTGLYDEWKRTVQAGPEYADVCRKCGAVRQQPPNDPCPCGYLCPDLHA